jgi:Undecaprenyl-phosphate galactose phosphotransferase WbaP
VEELRRLTISTSIVFLLVTGLTFWGHSAARFSRLTFAFAWIIALVSVPLSRTLFRSFSINLGIWGEPVAVIGYGIQGQEVVQFLQNNQYLGLRPVLLINGFSTLLEKSKKFKATIPHQNYDEGDVHLENIETVLLITSEMPESIQDAVINKQQLGFKRLILIPNLDWVGSVGVIPHDLEGYLGLEVRQNLLINWLQAIKRMLDLFIVIISSLIVVPLGVIIALIIRIDSPGGVFYSQDRIGKGGKTFKMWKFRTMVSDANLELKSFLANNPDATVEWDQSQKLRNDPRITRVGRLIRRLSLDELPQFWNVLRGEMSLVGPRPFFSEQRDYYGLVYNLYIQVLPGMTGLWQVSGRNDVRYDKRVRLDEYYVRNWSIWLDIYIIIKTIWTVLRGEGAY